MGTSGRIHTGYRELLKEAFAAATAKNPRFSMRAFARQLGLSPATLSNLLRGQKGLSPRRAKSVAERLDWPAEKRDQFMTLVEAEHARSPGRRQLAKRKLRRFDLADLEPAREEKLDPIASWLHLAITELTHTRGFDPSAAAIARELGVTRAEVEGALIDLVEQGFLGWKDGRWVDLNPILATSTDVPSPTLRKFHKSLLMNLHDRIDVLPVKERVNEAAIFAVSKDELRKVKAMIERFQEELVDTLNGDRSKSKVYCLSIHLWNLGKDGPE